jgi:hypothetical protein
VTSSFRTPGLVETCGTAGVTGGSSDAVKTPRELPSVSGVGQTVY